MGGQGADWKGQDKKGDQKIEVWERQSACRRWLVPNE